MTAKEIKEFEELIGKDAKYMLFGDNAINFPKTDNSYIIIDETNEMLYYISNIGNTMEHKTTPTEFDKCHTENIQYCKAYLTSKQAEDVINKLLLKNIIDSELKTEMLENNILFGRSSKEFKESNITKL